MKVEQLKVFTIKEDGVGLPAENPNLSDDIKAKIKEGWCDVYLELKYKGAPFIVA